MLKTAIQMRRCVILINCELLIACASERPDFGKVQAWDQSSREETADGGLDSSIALTDEYPDASASKAGDSGATREPRNPVSSSHDSNQMTDAGVATDGVGVTDSHGSSRTPDSESGDNSVSDSGAAPSTENDKGDSGVAPEDSGPENSSETGSWCDTQSPSASIALMDFQCLDFETEVMSEVWVSAITGNATLGTTDQRAFSLSTSLQARVPVTEKFADRAASTLTWTNVGPEIVSGARLAMRVNPVGLSSAAPAWTGSVSLACVGYGSAEVCLRYTKSETTSGLFLSWIFAGGPAVGDECRVSEQLNFELWNELELSIDADDRIQVQINGTEATTECIGSFGTGTVATFSVGLESYQATSQAWTVYFDDVVAETMR